MFSEELKEKSRDQERKWRKMVSSMHGERGIKQTTNSGIEIKPAYGPGDIKELDYGDIGMPGQYPFTRGNYPLHYQVVPFAMTQGYGMDTAEETRRRREWLASLGSRFFGETGEELTVYVLAIDLPTQRGLDPDDPGAAGRVGQCGISISTVWDFVPLYEGLPLEKIFTSLIAFDNVLPVTALYAAYALDMRKEPLEKLFMVCCNFHYHQWAWDTISFPPKTAMKIQVEFIKWVIGHCPLSYPGHAEGYNVAEAGANPVQEIAFNFSATIAIMEECIAAGLYPDDVAPRFTAHPHIGLNFFEEIAKIRVSRRLWAKIMKERFGCKRPESLLYRIFVAQTAGVELTAQEPLNNIIRTTIMALAGMLADVEGCWISSYDEALCTPTEEAVKICVRTYQILSEETDIPKVTDPLGGSYYVEWLTSKMEEEVEKILKQMEEMGGYLKCWESGWIRKEVEKSAYRRFKDLKSGEKVKVGMNKYRTKDSSNYEPYRPSPGAEEKAVLRIKKYREERDDGRTSNALLEVKKAASNLDSDWPNSCGILMPALVDAARAGATAGEMHRILRDVFGYGYFSG